MACAFVARAGAAAGSGKWKTGTTGSSNDNTKWENGAKPGRNDKATVDGNVSVDVNEVWGALEFISGNITGTNSLQLLDVAASTWADGAFDTINVSTTSSTSFVISTGSGLAGATPKTLKNGARLDLLGTTTWSGDTIATGGGAAINNSGSFTLSGAGALRHDATIGGPLTIFTNNGTFTKDTTAGDAEIETVFNNSGNVNVSAGALKLKGGGTSSGNVTIASGANLTLVSAYTIDGGTLGGAGTVAIESGTTTLTGTTGGSAALEVKPGAGLRLSGNHSSTGALTLRNGTIDGSGSGSVGSFTWDGGTISGANLTTSGATLGGNGTRTLAAGGQLNLAGTSAWSSDITTGGSATKLKNTGNLTTGIDGTLVHDATSDGRATFRNEGTFTKSSAASGTTELQTRFENASGATVTIESGKLKLSGGGANNGNIVLGANTSVEVTGTDYAFSGGVLGGSGTIDVTSATASFANTSGSAHLKVSGTGQARFDGTHSTTGTLTLAGGSLTGSGNVTAGSLQWQDGTLDARVTASGATLSGGAKTLGSGAELTFAGNSSWDGTTLAANGSAKLKNNAGATFTASGNGTLSSNGSAVFTNAGTFEKAAGGGATTTILQTRFDNTGTLRASGGTLRLAGGGSSSGTVDIGTAGTLQISGGNYTFENAAFAGAGTLELTGATTRFKGNSGSVRLNVAGGNVELDTSVLSASTLTLAGGTIASNSNGSADVGALAWTGGTLDGKVKSGAAAISGPATRTLGSSGELVLTGATAWDGARIDASGNGRIHNQSGGTFVAAADGVLANSGSAVFANDGTFTKAGGASGGATRIEARFENNGTVNVASGKLQLVGGGRNAASIVVASAAELEIGGNLELTANSTFTGDGIGRLLAGGLLNASGNIRIRTFSFEGGALAGSQTFHGTVEWSGGNWSSATAGAATTIASGATLNFRSPTTHDYDGRSILNYGTINWHSGNLRGGSGSVFANHSVFNDLNAGNRSLSSASGAASFTNNGEYRKSQAGTTTVDIPFVNNGTVRVASGSLLFSSAFTNNGAIVVANGAAAQFNQPLVFGAAHALTGTGTINAPSVVAGGTVAPGASPGTLTLTGDLTLLATSALVIELGGTTQGSGYDFISVGGTGLLAGDLRVSFLNGFQWNLPANATFTILTANGGLTGAFANVVNGGRISTTDNAATFQVNYGLGSSVANSVVLSNFVVAVPEPSTYALMALGSLVVLFSFRRRSR